MNAMKTRMPMVTVLIPKTTPLRVHKKISVPTRKRISAISRRPGMEAMITGIYQSTNAS